MERRQLLGAGALALGTLSIGYAIFKPASDEELIAAVLNDLGTALSFSKPIENPMIWGTHLSGEFKELMTPQVHIRVSEVSGKIPGGRQQLGLAAAQVLQRYGHLDVSFSTLNTQINGNAAQVEASTKVTGTLYGETKSDTRDVHLEMTKADGQWRIQVVTVHAIEADP